MRLWESGRILVALNKYRKLVAFIGGLKIGGHDVGINEGDGAPTNGASGTGQGVYGPGSMYIDRTNGIVYINTNTKASPTWTVLVAGGAGSVDGLRQLGVARATFDPSGTAGLRTVGAHGLGVTLPQYALVVGGFFQVNTAFTSAGGNDGTIAISVEGANDIQTAAAVSGAPFSTIGKKAIVPKANTPESTGILCTAAREITATVAVDALTAGKLTAFLYYVIAAAQA